MKRILILFVALSCMFGTVNGQELQSKFLTFRNLCLDSRSAYKNKDADKLAGCVMRMFEMEKSTTCHLDKWTKLTPEMPQDTTLYEGHLLYDVRWMDNIVEKWSASDCGIDVSTPVRGKGLLYVNYMIPAKTSLSFTSKGRGLMTVMVIAEDNTNIKMTVDQESCNHHYSSSERTNNGCLYDVWQAQKSPAPMTPYVIKVTNPSDHDVVCVFVTD